MNTRYKRDICILIFIAALLTIAKIWKQLKGPSMVEWIKRCGIYTYICVCVCVCVYTHTYIMKYYSAIKNKDILPFVTTWMDLEGIMLSEISQTIKDKYCMISLTCGI